MSLFSQGLIAYFTVGAFVASLFRLGVFTLLKRGETDSVEPDVFFCALITFGWFALIFTTVKRAEE